MAILEVKNLSKKFGGLQAVSNVTFDLNEGEILGLIGPNGAGKSTTLHLIIGIHKPTKGIINFKGEEIQRFPIHKRIKLGISVMFQHSRPLGRQTVMENIKLSFLPDKFKLFSPKGLEESITEVAEVVGLEKYLNKYPKSLPFGIVRRMELAKALALKPELLLLDEPFAGLSHSEVREFSDLIKSIKKDNLSIILIDHNVKAVYNLVDRIVAIHSGKVISTGKPKDVISDKAVKKVFLGEETENIKPKVGNVNNDDSRDTLLEVDIKSLKYGKAQALKDVKFEIKEGQFVSIVGLNGAGKTSLFKAIFSFVRYDGDIKWRGESLKNKRTYEIVKQGISLVPETRELFKYMTIHENLQLAVSGINESELNSRLEEVYTLFPRLKERYKQLVFTLSGGEQQMLNIARSLMQKPKMIVLDEPTLGLAPIILENISRTLDYMYKEMNLTILLGEQNLYFALKHSEKIYFLEHGSLVCNCPVDEFMEKVGEKYLA